MCLFDYCELIILFLKKIIMRKYSYKMLKIYIKILMIHLL